MNWLKRYTVLALIFIITVGLTLVVLYTVNYFTVFGYYLPHKAKIIYMEPGDTAATAHPGFIAINGDEFDMSVKGGPFEEVK